MPLVTASISIWKACDICIIPNNDIIFWIFADVANQLVYGCDSSAASSHSEVLAEATVVFHGVLGTSKFHKVVQLQLGEVVGYETVGVDFDD